MSFPGKLYALTVLCWIASSAAAELVPLKQVKSLLNAARLYAAAGEGDRADAVLVDAIAHLGTAPGSKEKAQAWAHAGFTWQMLIHSCRPVSGDWKHRAIAAYEASRALGLEHADMATASFAAGELARIYRMEGKHDEALRWVNEAAFRAQQIGAIELMFRWEWLSAQLNRDLARDQEALAAYRRAIESYSQIRWERSSEAASAGFGFADGPGAVFAEATDLLLRLSAEAKDLMESNRKLLEARNTIERLRSAELEDFFRDDCASMWVSKQRAVEWVLDRAAVIYLMPFSDRIEVIISRGRKGDLPDAFGGASVEGSGPGIGGSILRRFTVGVGAAEFSEVLVELRRLLEKRTTYEYLPIAQRVWNWLIGPMIGELRAAGVRTLVWVPSGVMRLVPPGALHDGDSYLVEEFAIAIVPGLKLVDPKPLGAGPLRALIAGSTLDLPGYPALAEVSREIQFVREMFGGTQLLDAEFRATALERELARANYTLVHIASHAYFDREARTSYVMVQDGKLDLNAMERLIRPARYRGAPVELLVLSACETAVGDGRAGLGLAGVALKSGARSALATLWHVNDEATSRVITMFYRQLCEEHRSKADALRAAQMALLDDIRYRHPCYWSPYLIIGNWQ